MITLRPYQAAAVESVYTHLRERDDNPCIVIPTGGGKTPIIATICRDAVLTWGGRVMILSHVKELLQQNARHIREVAPELARKVGLYSAGLRGRDTEHPIIVGGIQSVYRRACQLGRFDLILIDEAHLVPADGEGMYRSFIEDARKINPAVRFIGLTATPYRMKTGLICAPENILNSVCYEIGVRRLILDGFLSPLRSKAGRKDADLSSVHKQAGEFVPGELEQAMNEEGLVQSACQEIMQYTDDRKACLIFASGVDHGKHVADVLRGMGVKVSTIFGDTPSEERSNTIEDFKAGRIKYLVNMQVLTTGFDAPNIDFIGLLRPTMSPGLYYQMVGRGFRLSPGKTDCLVLDYGGNILRHGPVDEIKVTASGGGGQGGEAPTKKCPECFELIAAGYAVCPCCGFVFPRPEVKHSGQAATAGVLSGQVVNVLEKVDAVHYAVHYKRGAETTAPPTMRVEYLDGFKVVGSEWICFEHEGWALQKAQSWWRARSMAPVPSTVSEAVEMAKDGALCATSGVTLRRVAGEKYDRIIGYELGKKPYWVERNAGEESLDSILFEVPKPQEVGAGDEDVPF